MFKEGLAAVQVMATFPVTAPAEPGAKVAVKVVLWFAASVVGTEIPLAEAISACGRLCDRHI